MTGVKVTSPAASIRVAAWVLFVLAVVGPDRLFWRALAVSAFLVVMSISYEMFAARIVRSAAGRWQPDA